MEHAVPDSGRAPNTTSEVGALEGSGCAASGAIPGGAQQGEAEPTQLPPGPKRTTWGSTRPKCFSPADDTGQSVTTARGLTRQAGRAEEWGWKGHSSSPLALPSSLTTMGE